MLAHTRDIRNGIEAMLKGPKGRFGPLQRQVRRAFIATGNALTTRQLAEWCFPRIKSPRRWQIDNQARAAKSLGARPAERVGQQRVWRLKAD
jgi:hypothetical protein